MTTQLDTQWGFKKETTFKTAVTVDTFTEITEEDMNWMPTFAQGSGFRVAQRVDYSDRRRVSKEEVGGSCTFVPRTKGMGKYIEAALGGTGTSTNIAGASYQQLFTPTTTDYLSSYTIQVGIPPLGGGTTLPMTFDGCVCSGFEFSVSDSADPSIKFDWVGAEVTTATALATASYPSGDLEFVWPDVTITLGTGTVTVPTTTALATGGTAVANVRSLDLKYENSLDSNGFNAGSTGKRTRKPALGKRMITGSIVAEFDAVTYRDAYLAQTDFSLVVTLQYPTTAISGSNYPTLQFTIPVIRFDGELPKPNGGDVVTLSMDFTALDGRVAAHPFYVAIVTAETAI